MKVIQFFGLLLLTIIVSCNRPEKGPPLSGLLNDLPKLQGKEAYRNSTFVTAGDRVYMVGFQDGTFPDLGFHVEGEMGGIWNHPIKLMDGFTANIVNNGKKICLDDAAQFINFPIGNKHIFKQSVPDITVERFQFVPDGLQGLVIEYSFQNHSNIEKTFQFEFEGHTDLLPVWLSENLNWVDHEDDLTYDSHRNAWLGKDKGNEWYVLFGSDTPPIAYESIPESSCNYKPQGKGVIGKLTYNIEIPAKRIETLRFVIAGSYQNQKEVETSFDQLQKNPGQLLLEKRKHYEKIGGLAKLSLEDETFQQAFDWVKYNTQWLLRDVPEIGRGLGAGMPDYPWWFGVDNEYTLKGAIATGRKELVYETIELIHQLSETNGNGRIIHEASTNGIIFNPGNINETPQFSSLIWWVFQWTGDKEFLSKYYPTVKKGLQWLMEENDEDGNLFPDGYGMMEIHGLESEMIDVATYTQKAFADAAQMAKVMEENDQATYYQDLAEQMKVKINKEFWVEEFNSYADFIGTTSEALQLIEAAIIRADTLNKPWAVDELKETKKKISSYPKDKKQGFVIFHNWVVNTPMEMGIADQEKAIKALEKGSKFVNPFGVFVTGIDRDESSELEDGSFAGSRVFSYTGAVMTLPTGVQAIAENNYGRPDKALDYLNRLTRSFSFALPGSIYEVSPDYGMMTQAWNLYAYAVPVVTQFFGIHPSAHLKRIRIQPNLPNQWKKVKLENVVIADNSLDIEYQQNEKGLEVNLAQNKENWTLIFHLDEATYTQVLINGKVQDFPTNGQIQIELNGRKNKIELIH